MGCQSCHLNQKFFFSCQSSLLNAILGELSQESGVVKVKGEVTYTSQQPWILPGTVRSNILFGKEFNPKKYDRVLRACALKRVRMNPDAPYYYTFDCIVMLSFNDLVSFAVLV